MDFPAWDPVLFDIPFLPIDIRWYGMMYVVGFICAQWIFVRLARSGFFPVSPEAAPDLIFYCVFGVMLGGRAGYALFYDHSLLNPLVFLQVWKGGLAFHGGLAGVCVSMWLFCRHHKIGWGRVADATAIAGTPGIFAVRMANFINGELYGRVTDATTWGAMQFPTDPAAMQLLHVPEGVSMRDRELCIQVAYGNLEFADVKDRLSVADDLGRPINWDAIEPYLNWESVSNLVSANGEHLIPFRHPSQLYEGFGEGLLLGLVLLVVYLMTRKKPMRTGRYAAIFLMGYAIIRGGLEMVRKPDAQFYENGKDGTVLLGMTMGQTLSAAMVVGALMILFWPRKPESEPTENPGVSAQPDPQKPDSSKS
ncbi:MAG: phosphatidylglycerol:prolipoprotein diacylglycerol transferase [Hyphomicrobiaceae bacterium]|jgi:phosphatidylglycerol:prolipoprotein diacylglycerol transferase